MKILVINGPNLNLLGRREPGIYGVETYQSICEMIKNAADKKRITTEFFQSNHEGAIIDKIHEMMDDYDGCIINPGAYTHYSYAIYDAIKAVEKPFVEVHISDVDAREPFRAISVTAPACIEKIAGHGTKGYVEALEILREHIISCK